MMDEPFWIEAFQEILGEDNGKKEVLINRLRNYAKMNLTDNHTINYPISDEVEQLLSAFPSFSMLWEREKTLLVELSKKTVNWYGFHHYRSSQWGDIALSELIKMINIEPDIAVSMLVLRIFRHIHPESRPEDRFYFHNRIYLDLKQISSDFAEKWKASLDDWML